MALEPSRFGFGPDCNHQVDQIAERTSPSETVPLPSTVKITLGPSLTLLVIVATNFVKDLLLGLKQALPALIGWRVPQNSVSVGLEKVVIVTT